MSDNTHNGESSFIPDKDQEYAIARDNINARGVYSALTASRKRLEEVTNKALDRVTLPVACRAGCGYCCNYRIFPRAEEIFMIVDYLRTHFPPHQAREIRETIARNAKTLKKLSRHERLTTNLVCAFLKNDSCSIYEVRPNLCRIHFSSDVNTCLKSVAEPDNQNIKQNVDIGLHNAVHTVNDAFVKALHDTGHEATGYEMNLALAASITDSRPRNRYERKKRAFSSSIAQFDT